MLVADIRQTAPDWAVKQRRLIASIEEAVPLFLGAHTLESGGLRRHGKLDDDYECFKDWPLFYIIGGGEKILESSLKSWDAITGKRADKGDIYREFIKSGDMLHISEGYVGFQYFGLADPTNQRNRDRARRFAGFYIGEDPEAPNYDPEYRVIRSPFTGSAGPALEHCETIFPARALLEPSHQWASLYPVVKDPEPDYDSSEIQELVDRVITRSDVAMNLAVTGLVTNAYLYTGDEKYKKWILEYVGAWLERTIENNGIIPDNIGPTGKIGEHREGQWWGGFFGWTNIYSVEMISNAVITASECAFLLSGDPQYLLLLRSLVDVLLDRSITRDGNLLVPHKVGPDGWFDYQPLTPSLLSHLWHASMAAEDWGRIERIREGTTQFDWDHVLNDIGHANEHRFNEPPHLSYLGGTNPGWPEKILHAEGDMVRRNVDRIRSGTYEEGSQTTLNQSPVLTNGLAQMTMGAPYTCFNGGLLCAAVRYFDTDRARPGLPPDVSALVEKIHAETTVVHLVNLSANQTRNLIVQAGAHGEHDFTEVTFLQQAGDGATESTLAVNEKFIAVELPPGTSIEMNIGTRRFVNRPTYDFPWSTGQRITAESSR